MKTRYYTLIKALIVLAILPMAGCLDSGGSAASSGFGGDSNIAPGPRQEGSPSISGNPQPAIRVGEFYSFTPQAEDPDGDTLTFSISNKPGWATFDPATGQISGLPSMGDVGNYSSISISVSDGENTVSLPEFTVEVTQVGTASTSLSWSAPLENEDGSALTDLAGFTIYFGRAPGDYTNQIRIDNPTVSTYFVDNLSPGTYYFAATAFNASGVESRMSNEVVKSL